VLVKFEFQRKKLFSSLFFFSVNIIISLNFILHSPPAPFSQPS